MTSYIDNWVTSFWSLKDNDLVIAENFMLWTNSEGEWENTIELTYTGVPIDHCFEFAFSDNGHGGGAHSWVGAVLGGTTIDPVRPSSTPAPVPEPTSLLLFLTELFTLKLKFHVNNENRGENS